METHPFSVESLVGKHSGHCILRVSGPLDIETESRFLEQVRAETAPVVILDLSGVQYCASAGVAALVQVHNAFERENRRLALVGLHQRVEKPLEITRVRPLFTVFETLTEAEEALI
jgi:anti-sigma B factor antagonist